MGQEPAASGRRCIAWVRRWWFLIGWNPTPEETLSGEIQSRFPFFQKNKIFDGGIFRELTLLSIKGPNFS